MSMARCYNYCVRWLMIVGLAGGVAAAAPPKKDDVACTAEAIAKVRKQAEAELRAGNADAAVALLQPGEHCFLENDGQSEALQRQIVWRISDLSFALFKAGKFEECYAIAASEAAPYPGNAARFDDTVQNALEHNAKLCKEADHKARGAFQKPIKCNLEGDWGIPATVLTGSPAACLAIGASHKDKDNLLVCGKVSLVEKSPGGRVSRTKLAVDGGNLEESSICCNIDTVGFAKHGATWAVRVHSEGRDCNGGTASSEEEIEYELHGTKLDVVHSLTATMH
jgi:hypothetical protein